MTDALPPTGRAVLPSSSCSPLGRWPRAAAQDARLEAAKKEGKVVWYTSLALPSAEKVAKLFEAAYPGIKVEVHRTGSERILARVMQERRPTSRTWTWCTPPTPATSCSSRSRSC